MKSPSNLLAGRDRSAGSRELSAAAIMLAVLALGLFAVSLAAQQQYVLAAKHATWVSWIEGGALDVGLVVFTLLALGLARKGMPARTERILIMACAVMSALMNYAAADVISPRSVLAFVMPPIFLAVCVDRLVAVVRRWVLGHDDRSAWIAGGRAATSGARGLAMFALYVLRVPLSPISTLTGLRRQVLNMTPLPSAAEVVTQPDTRPHGELLYPLGGFASPPPAPEPAVPAPKRKRPVAAKTEPKTALPDLPKPAELPSPPRPRIVPDPAPRQGQVSRPIEITDAAWTALESGMPAEKLATVHPELGSRARVKQIVDAYRAGRLVPGADQVVDDAPVVWADDQDGEAASGGE